VWVEQTVVMHHKTWLLARFAGLDAYSAVGRLVALWGWALDAAPDGRIVAADAELVATAMSWHDSIGGELRERFDRLQMQRERDARGTTGRRASSYGSRPGEPEMGADEYYAAFKQRLALRESGARPEPEGGGTAA
jgi:hypothetical protein